MKNLNRAAKAASNLRLAVPLLIIAIVAIIGFSMAACDNGSGTGGSNGGGGKVSGGVTYTVTYNTVGATGTPPETLTVTAGTIITLIDDSGFSRNGLIFDGWYTFINGTQTYYNAGSSYTVTDNVIFYANWIIALTVTFDTGESDVPTPITVGYGKTITITLPPAPVSNRGFQFFGWGENTYSGDIDTTYPADSSYTTVVNGSITFYAIWRFSASYSYTQPQPGGSGLIINTYIFNIDGTYKVILSLSNNSSPLSTSDLGKYYIVGNQISGFTIVDSNTIRENGNNGNIYTKN